MRIGNEKEDVTSNYKGKKRCTKSKKKQKKHQNKP